MELINEIKKAIEFTKNKDYKSAKSIYNELLKIYPDNASLLSFYGLFYFNLKDFKNAEKYLLKSYQINNSKDLESYIGICQFNLSKYKSAITFLEKAINNDNSLNMYIKLINSCQQSKDYKKAYKYSEQAYSLYPVNENILELLSDTSIKTGQFENAEKYTKLLLKMNPKSVQGWYHLGLMSEIFYGNEAGARECYRKMIKYGDKCGGYINLGISYSKNKSTRIKARYYYNKAYSYGYYNAPYNFLFASSYLSNKQFKKGYEYFIQPDIGSEDDNLWFAQFKNRWDGKIYKDEILLVYGDQGLGDQIQYCRYLPFLAEKFKTIKIVVSKSLIEIFKRSLKEYKNFKFYSKESKLPTFDKSVFMSYLPYYLKKNFSNIPSSNEYLIPDNKKIEQFKEKYFKHNKLKIGICWEAGATGLREQIHRSMNIENFEPIIKLENAKIYSLKINPSTDSYKKYSQLINLAPELNDFDDTAAVLNNLDIIITVDTSLAHIAGALGVKTFLLLPYCSDWRWFNNTENTEWYDSIRIFKQEIPLDWESVFNRVIKELNYSV